MMIATSLMSQCRDAVQVHHENCLVSLKGVYVTAKRVMALDVSTMQQIYRERECAPYDYFLQNLLQCRLFVLKNSPSPFDRCDLIVPICENGCIRATILRATLELRLPNLCTTRPFQGLPSPSRVENQRLIEIGIKAATGKHYFPSPLTLADIPKLIARIGQPPIMREASFRTLLDEFIIPLKSAVIQISRGSELLKNMHFPLLAIFHMHRQALPQSPSFFSKLTHIISWLGEIAETLERPSITIDDQPPEDIRFFFRHLMSAVEIIQEFLQELVNTQQTWNHLLEQLPQRPQCVEDLQEVHRLTQLIDLCLTQLRSDSSQSHFSYTQMHRRAESRHIFSCRRLILMTCSAETLPYLAPYASEHVQIHLIPNVSRVLENVLSVDDAAYKTTMVISSILQLSTPPEPLSDSDLED